MYCQFLFVTRTTLYSTLHWCDVILIWSITNGHQNKDSLIIMDAITTFSFGLYLLFAFIALICEYIDSALGGGYGTILVPVMMIAFNIDKKFLIPAVLVSETVTGLGSALLHHYVGNANFNIRKKNNSSEFNKTNDILKRYNSPSGIIKENGYNQNFFSFNHFRILWYYWWHFSCFSFFKIISNFCQDIYWRTCLFSRFVCFNRFQMEIHVG